MHSKLLSFQRILGSICILFLLNLSIVGQSDTTKEKNLQFTGIPTVGYSNSFGLQLGAMAMLIFDVNKNDTISPASSLVGIGFFTTNKTWFSVLAQRLFFREDNWRIVWAFGKSNMNFQFYTEEIPGMTGTFIDYSTASDFAFLQLHRRVYSRLYAGLSYKYNRMNTGFYTEDIIGENIDSLKTLSGWGIPLSWDTRDDVYNAYEGLFINLKFEFNEKWIGSDLDFSTISIDINHFFKAHSKAVLASRATIYSGIGEIPFEGLKAIGRNDIRGYTNGKYRGDQVYTAQIEYRHFLPKKFGFVTFFGLAATYNSLAEDNTNWSGLLPSIGLGARYTLLEERRLNMGIDIAIGKEDWGLYFRLGEAF